MDGLTLLDMAHSSEEGNAALRELGVRSAIHRSRIRAHARALAATPRALHRTAAAAGVAAADWRVPSSDEAASGRRVRVRVRASPAEPPTRRVREDALKREQRQQRRTAWRLTDLAPVLC